jgi:hypothetical protein
MRLWKPESLNPRTRTTAMSILLKFGTSFSEVRECLVLGAKRANPLTAKNRSAGEA